ncbi:MAG: NADH-quinone oxidoreductase subunit NuoE [Clostridiaceae bacterium]|nr:NADH-quinone oxidoreductase subunit NuoE [Clostridiaceae bacterium]
MPCPETGCCGNSNANSLPLDKVNSILAKYQNIKGALIPVLQATQNAYGYLPKEILIHISKEMKISISQIYGVVTFYSQFHLQPRGKYIIRVCQGTACHVRGAKTILETVEKNLGIKPGETTSDALFTLETVACIGACGLAPVLMINDDTHGRLTPDITSNILKKYN